MLLFWIEKGFQVVDAGGRVAAHNKLKTLAHRVDTAWKGSIDSRVNAHPTVHLKPNKLGGNRKLS